MKKLRGTITNMEFNLKIHIEYKIHIGIFKRYLELRRTVSKWNLFLIKIFTQVSQQN